MNWYLAVLKNYTGFTGRARRKEFWMFALCNLLISLLLRALDHLIGTTFVAEGEVVGILGTLYGLAVLIPSMAVAIRRLHDGDHAGWWLFMALLPIVGSIVLLVFMLQQSTPGPNRFGPSPRLDFDEPEPPVPPFYHQH
ncbi:uncharacterized membrane protein YhaH (DUF805 family) [Silvimonas terrae]|uniref:Uncharacterized membrane protein YhaH (DUF805 family) n=1 Tax=Silvimonas terrae TaxID=300266 RepID=A0A840RAG2_9NEIS|nr:DUF805 domain-containing protein [Silvimonas terrae]MBB5189897.1 uncharacterized membrane protein YhaH (DUF805 family) [Silvimonas terrae]